MLNGLATCNGMAKLKLGVLCESRFDAYAAQLHVQMYDAKRFTDAGFRHYELYFPDGSCPPDTITARFLELAEKEPGKISSSCSVCSAATVCRHQLSNLSS